MPVRTITAAEYQAAQRSAWTEADFTRHVITAARQRGWLAAHFRPARTKQGWTTAMIGDVGYPDLTLARRSEVIWAELKVGANKPTRAQSRWLNELGGQVWTPTDWDLILRTLH